jgi:hypothetical protein
MALSECNGCEEGASCRVQAVLERVWGDAEPVTDREVAKAFKAQNVGPEVCSALAVIGRLQDGVLAGVAAHLKSA